MSNEMGLCPVSSNLDSIYAPFYGVDLYLYLIHGSGTTVLIDSGINSTPEEVVAPTLAPAGLEPDLLICTHGHVDHFGGNGALRRMFPELRIALHHADAPWAEDHERHLFEMYMCMPQTWQFDDGGDSHLEMCGPNTAVDIQLETGQQLEVPPYSFTVLHTPGHSPGHVVLHDSDRQVAVCGDVALGDGVTTPEGTSVPPYYCDPIRYLASIERTVGLGAETYCTGHNGALDRAGMIALAELSRAFVEQLDSLTFGALSRNEPRSLEDVVAGVSRQLPNYEIGFHMNASVQAHLAGQVRAGRARVVIIDNLKHYLAS